MLSSDLNCPIGGQIVDDDDLERPGVDLILERRSVELR